MLKKLLVALVASAFTLGAYAQAPAAADSKGQGQVKAEKKAKKSVKKSSKSSKAKKSEDAKK
jgi:hypothetical protein